MNSKEENGMTPLFFTISKECMQLLIEKGATVNSQDVEGKTPLHTEVRKGSLETVKLLIESGANVNLGDDGKKMNLLIFFHSNKKLNYNSSWIDCFT